MPSLPRIALLTALVLACVVADASAASRVTVADPAGGARWTATQAVSGGGRMCVTVRRGRAHRGTTCARLDSRRVFSYTLRTQRAARPRAVRTILVVALAPNVVRARLQTPGRARTYRRRSGRPRVLLAVLAGRVERPTLRVDARIGGRTTRVIEGAPPAVQVADPLDGPAWRTRHAAASGGGACVAWERVPPRFAATPDPERGQARCGDAEADVPVAAAQRVSRRLVVFGLAGAGVRSAVLRTPAGEQSLPIESKTRAFLAVLRDDVDPGALRVVVRLGDGREVERTLDAVG